MSTPRNDTEQGGAATSDDVLVCRHLVKRFDDKVAIDDVSFEVREGEIVGLLGPNGAGKTTLIRMIIDIFQPDEGDVRFLGRRMGDPLPAGLSPHGCVMRDLLGYLPEERGLYRRGRVAEVLEYLGRLHGLSARDAHQRVTEGLEAVNLAGYANKRVIDLSKGMTQRAQFVAASVHRPRLLILDEPFSGFDPVGVQWALEQIRAFRRDGATVLLSAHQMALVERLCDRVVMINRGRRVLYGTLEELRAGHETDHVIVGTPAALDTVVPDLSPLAVTGDQWAVRLDQRSAHDVLRRLLEAQVPVTSYTAARPTLEEIFLEEVRRGEAVAT